MCGISGSIKLNGFYEENDEKIQSSLNAIAHRGPEDRGFTIFDQGCFGQVRLAIVDPGPTSHQPFISDDQRYYLVYNGEIFNFRSLRKTLEDQGVKFKTEGDTELLFQLLIQLEEKAIEVLNGFFAFAFFDKEKQKLILARDRMGIKPVWYHQNAKELHFSSEMRGLHPFINEKELDFTSLQFYFRMGYVPAPYSVLKTYSQLQPGHWLIAEKGETRLHQFYTIPTVSQSANTSGLRSLLEDSIKLRLLADRPVGTFLSGGIDSSIISAIAAKFKSDIDTFSLSFPEFEYLNEGNIATKTAKHIGSNHHAIEIRMPELLECLPDFLKSIDTPFADSSALASWLLCRETSKYVKVALSGDGADELFGGYRKHRAALLFKNRILGSLLKFVPIISGNRENPWLDRFRKLGRLASISRLSETERVWELANYSDSKHSSGLLKFGESDFQKRKSEILENIDGSGLSMVLDFDRKIVLPDDMLHKTDNMSMAHALEVRVPFLDHRIVAWAARQDPSTHLNQKQGKLHLRSAFADLLLPEVLHQPKRGFEIPLHSLMLELPEYWLFRFNKDLIQEQGIFNWENVKNLQENRHCNAFDQWAYLIFQSWYFNLFQSKLSL